MDLFLEATPIVMLNIDEERQNLEIKDGKTRAEVIEISG